MIRQFSLACSAGLILALAACGGDSTGVSAKISQADATKLAADMDAVSNLGTADFGLGAAFSVGVDPYGSTASAVTTFNNAFDVTRPCPKGGTVQLKGTVVGTGDRTTHSLTIDANAVRTDAACAFAAKDGGIITVNGNPNIAHKGHLNIVNGAFVGLQTQSHVGHITVARGSAAAVPCDISVESSFDPATHTVTVKGNICDHVISETHTRA
jgi:hypothetical protein